MKILNLGSLNLDFVYSVDHICVPGETISSHHLQVICGGKGLNQSVALARAGAQVFHAGLVGPDGEMLLAACRDNGIDASRVQTVDTRSGNAIIQVSADGQNCIVLYGGANRCQTKESIDAALDGFGPDDILLLQNEINLVDYAMRQGAARGMKVALNPSPFNDAMRSCDLSLVDIFIVNEIEGEQITGCTTTEDICRQMSVLFPEAAVVLTLGASGAIYQDKTLRVSEPAAAVKVVDTTAAGDTFLGYFLAGVMQRDEVAVVLRHASLAAGIAVSRMGATPSIPLRSEVLERAHTI